MLRYPNELIALGSLLLGLAVIAAVWAPAAFEWNFVFAGAGAVCVGLLERNRRHAA